MNNFKPLAWASLALVVLGLFAAPSAQAGTHVSVNIGGGYCAPAYYPAYGYYPRPYYAQPVYYRPAYYAPPPRAYYPAPVYRTYPGYGYGYRPAYNSYYR